MEEDKETERVCFRTGSPEGMHRQKINGKMVTVEGPCPACGEEGGPGPAGVWSGCQTCGWCY